MQKVIVQIDWYTKIVLTLIAVLLAGLLAKPYVVSRPAGAYGEQEVHVTNKYPIPVEIKGGSVSAYITGHSGSFTVVDWKEIDDYYEYLKKLWEKRG